MDLFTVLFILLFLTMLSVLVAAHEYGHFLVAKLCKMDVEEFAIGFGKPFWTYMRKNGTDYTLRPLPLGGFVRIKGMQPEDDGSEVNIENGFYSKRPGARFLTLLAGPVFSILAGLAILIPLHSIHGIKARGTTIKAVVAGQPAEAAGIQGGDKIVSIDGTPVVAFVDVLGLLKDKAGVPVQVGLERNKQPITISVVPKADAKPSEVPVSVLRPVTEFRNQPKIGIEIAPVPVTVKASFMEAAGAALLWPVDMVKGLAKTLLSPSTIKDNVGGPVTIATESYAAARDGWDSFVQLAALLSISLGIFNLLPFAPLDGGQMLMAFIEMLRRGKRLSIRVQAAFQGVGLVAVFGLFLSVIFADVSRITGSKETKPAPAQKAP